MRSTRVNGIVAAVLIFAVGLAGQSGGDFALSQTVITSGGGTSSGGDFLLNSTKGQAAAGNVLTGPPFAVTSGFWSFAPLMPTAAPATVSGRVLTHEGRGIRNARITLTSATGVTRTVSTSTFGRFRIESVPAGETYIVGVSARRHTFPQPSVLLAVNADLFDVNFVAHP